MLDLHPSVMLALALSVGSAVLCVGYGLWRWTSDDDAVEDVPGREPVPEGEDGGSPREPDRV